MTRNDKLGISAMAAGSVLLPLLAAVALGWPQWLCALLVVPLLAFTYWAGVTIVERRRQEEIRAYQAAHPAPEMTRAAVEKEPVWHVTLKDIPVPSAEPDYHFLFSATIRWMHTALANTMVADPAAVMQHIVLNRVCALTASQPPVNPSLTQHEIASDLSIRRLDASRSITGWAEGVSLMLAPADARRLEKLAALRKEQQVWEHERGFEISKREYLSNDVLKTTGSAVVWRLAQDHNKVAETVDLIGTLAQLSAAANGEEVPELFRSLVSPARWGEPSRPDESGALWPRETFEYSTSGHHDVNPGVKLAVEMFGATDGGQRELFGDQLARLVERYGHSDIADRIRQDLGIVLPDSTPPPSANNPNTGHPEQQSSDVDTPPDDEAYLHDSVQPDDTDAFVPGERANARAAMRTDDDPFA